MSGLIAHPVALRVFYACHLAANGIAVPFFPVFVRDLGFSGKAMAGVISAAPLMHLGAPLLWGWMADRTRRPDAVLRVALLGAALFYVPMIFVRSLGGVVAAHLGHQLFAVAIAGLADSLSMARVRAGDDYGRIRFWGSLSFVVSCWVFGQILAARGQTADPLIPTLVPVFLGCAFVSSLFVRGRGTGPRPSAHDAKMLLRDRRFLFLLAMASLHWACTAPYHGFFAVLVRDRGLPTTVISNGFITAVVAEMVAFYFFSRIRARASLPLLLLWVTGASGLRWLGVVFVRDPVLLVALQALHGLTFGMFWGTCIAWLFACVPENLRATGQTLFTATTFGLGFLVGTLASGVIYDLAGSIAPAYAGAAAVNLVQAALVATLGRKLSPDVYRESESAVA